MKPLRIPVSLSFLVTGLALTFPLIPRANAAEPCVPPPAELAAWFRFENNTTDSQSGVSGALPTGASFTEGKVGSAIALDGQAGVVLPVDARFDQEVFTLEAWIRRDNVNRASLSSPGDGAIFAGGTQSYSLTMAENGTLFLSYVGVRSYLFTGKITDTDWHHVAMTRSGPSFRLFLDGVPAGQLSLSNPFITSGAFAIGSLSTPYLGQSFAFLGEIDEFSFYPRELTLEEVRSIAEADSAGKCAEPGDTPCLGESPNLVAWYPLDQDARNRVGPTVGSGSATFGPGKVQGAAFFDGVQLGIPLPFEARLTSQTFTVEAWVQRASLEGSSKSWPADGAIFGGGPNSYGVALRDNGTLYLSHLGVQSYFSSNARINDLEWHHVAVTKSGSIARFFLDGEEGGQVDLGSLVFDLSTPFAIGSPSASFNGYNYSFWGGIDELTVFDRALSRAEIRAIWQTGSDGKCPAAVALRIEPESPEVAVNRQTSYQLTVSNTGTNSLENLVVSNSVPATLHILGTSNSVGSVTISTVSEGAMVVYSIGTLAPGTQAILTVNVSPVGVATNTITAQLSATNLAKALAATAIIHSIPVCSPAPSGLLSWWRGESNSVDAVTGGIGGMSNGVSFVTGRIGTAFRFDGQTGTGVNLGASPALQRSEFSIEGWLRRGSLAGASLTSPGATILGADTGGWNFVILNSGSLAFGRSDASAVESGPVITDLAWHHVAMTRSATEVRYYKDGQLAATLPYQESFVLNQSYGLGGIFPSGRNAFLGDLDEIAFYDRILSAEEIAAVASAGGAPKCVEDLVLTATPGGPVPLGEDLNLTFTVSTVGSLDSTGVIFTNAVPAGMLILSVTSSQGTVQNLAGVLRGELGTIPAGSNAVIQLVLRPLVEGSYPLSAGASRAEAELTLFNNRAEIPLNVMTLTVGIAGDVTVSERGGKPASAEFEVVLNAPSLKPVQVGYETVEGTATAGVDFEARSGLLEFPPGTVLQRVSVPVFGDGIYELDETFQLALTNVVNAMLGASNAKGNIVSTDPIPILHVRPVLAAEGNSATTPFVFSATLDRPAGMEASAAYNSTNDTAKAPTDFTAVSGILVFAPGETNQTIEVAVNGDTSVEPNELFFLNFSAPRYLRFSSTPAAPVAGTIVNDDALKGQVVEFSWEVPAETQTVGAAFPATLVARDGTGAVIPGFGSVVGLQAFAGPGRPSGVVFTEVVVGFPCAVELQNVSNESVDVSGWTVALYDASRWPAPRGTLVIPAGTSVPSGGVFTVDAQRIGGGSYPRFKLDQEVGWNDRGTPAAPIATRMGAVLTNPYGQVEDAFFADGAEPAEVGVPALITEDDWAGEPAVRLLAQNTGYRRVAALGRNFRRASDWEQNRYGRVNLGRTNANFVLPFADAVPLAMVPPTVAEFVNGAWTGNVTLTGYAPEVRLLADDGNGHRGLSASIPMQVIDDLAVTMTTDAPVLAIPAWSAQFFVSVTNLGPVLSSNVTATVLLAPAYGIGPEVVSGRQISQGSASVTTVFNPGVGSQTKVTASFGELPAAGVATLRLIVNKGPGAPPSTLPTNIVSTVSLVREPAEANLLNNTASVVQEVSQLCGPLGESVAAWWRADGGFESVFNGLTGTPVGDAAVRGGRVGSGGFHFDGVGDAIRVADHEALDFGAGQSFALEMWVRIPPTTKPLITLLSKQQWTGPDSYVGYALVVRNGQLRLLFGNASWNLQIGDLLDGNWHHVAVSAPRSGEGNLDAWLDARVISAPGINLPPDDLSNDAPLRFGETADPDADGFLAGDLDEVVIYRRALTSVEVERAARAGAHGHCTSELTFQPIRPRFEFSNEWVALDSGVAGQPYHTDLELRNVGPLPATVATWVVPFDSLNLLQVQVGSETVEYNPDTGAAITSPFVVAPGSSVPLALKLVSTNAASQLVLLAQGGGVSVRQLSASLRIPMAADTDGDGIPNDVETAAGLNPDSAADATSDTDSDGWTAAQEFEAGTLANDWNSALRLRVVDGQVVFDALATRVYRLERSDVVGEGKWESLQTVRPESNGIMTVGPLLGDDASGYYRVLAELPY
ncbi:MAG TPA: Calx-beta domain-containing protein [Verrucomicrobiota bacterium]|nr:hypothetical protein [Verrucomicrobiales bacterium]HRI15084.1 Calx-beta domain-containing protein [Verrucomicrobiota bacterium]